MLKNLPHTPLRFPGAESVLYTEDISMVVSKRRGRVQGKLGLA